MPTLPKAQVRPPCWDPQDRMLASRAQEDSLCLEAVGWMTRAAVSCDLSSWPGAGLALVPQAWAPGVSFACPDSLVPTHRVSPFSVASSGSFTCLLHCFLEMGRESLSAAGLPFPFFLSLKAYLFTPVEELLRLKLLKHSSHQRLDSLFPHSFLYYSRRLPEGANLEQTIGCAFWG